MIPFPVISLEIASHLAYLRLRIKIRTTMRLWGDDYNKMEFAGAFGDLGTLIPFVVGNITLNKMDPLGILVAFGLFKIFAGLYFKTPIPVQRVKEE
jgi:hypothetical protein